MADWNKLEDTVVTADSVTAFSSADDKGLPPHIGSQSRNAFQPVLKYLIGTVK